MKNKKVVIYGLVFSVLMIGIITILFLLFLQADNNNSDSTKQQSKENGDIVDESNSDQNVELATNFQGQYLSAKLTEGWEITEFIDSNGLETRLDDIEYTGLTGLEISRNNEVIVYIKGFDGIGFPRCEGEKLYLFADSDKNYYETFYQDSNEIIDIEQAGIKYTEFDFVGNKIRRIGSELILDNDTSDSFFNHDCNSTIDLTDPGYFGVDKDGNKVSAISEYGIAINNEVSISDEDLIILDEILDNIELSRNLQTIKVENERRVFRYPDEFGDFNIATNTIGADEYITFTNTECNISLNYDKDPIVTDYKAYHEILNKHNFVVKGFVYYVEEIKSGNQENTFWVRYSANTDKANLSQNDSIELVCQADSIESLDDANNRAIDVLKTFEFDD